MENFNTRRRSVNNGRENNRTIQGIMYMGNASYSKIVRLVMGGWS